MPSLAESSLVHHEQSSYVVPDIDAVTSNSVVAIPNTPIAISTESSSHLSTPDFSSDNIAEGDEEDTIWPAEVETAFQEAYEIYPNNGRAKIKGVDGRLYGILSLHVHPPADPSP